MQGILLAAGFGRRFNTEAGPQQDKLLAKLPNQDKSILWHSANALITALPNSIAVVQAPQLARKKILQELGFLIVESTRAEQGMGDTIADAVRASESANGWLIALADMPWITAALVQKVSAGITYPESIAAPRFNGQRGQPVAFGKAWKEQLLALKGDTGAREILKAAPIDWVDWHDDSVNRDVDTKLDMIVKI